VDDAITPDLPASGDQRMRQRLAAEVRDAVGLLDFAVSQGRPLPDELIEKIKSAQNFLTDGAMWPSDKERSAFEKTYRDLAQLVKPITAATLRDTADSRIKAEVDQLLEGIKGGVCSKLSRGWGRRCSRKM
jgi:hypothetical protein